MSDAVPLEGQFIAASTETRALTGDVRVTRTSVEFASGLIIETRYVATEHARLTEPARAGSLPLYANPAGHWAEMREVTREKVGRAKRLTGGKGVLTLQYDDPASSLQINWIYKSLFGGAKVGPMLVYLSHGYHAVWAAEQAAKARR